MQPYFTYFPTELKISAFKIELKPKIASFISPHDPFPYPVQEKSPDCGSFITKEIRTKFI